MEYFFFECFSVLSEIISMKTVILIVNYENVLNNSARSFFLKCGKMWLEPVLQPTLRLLPSSNLPK